MPGFINQSIKDTIAALSHLMLPADCFPRSETISYSTFKPSFMVLKAMKRRDG
jgi:hypothetical protein